MAVNYNTSIVTNGLVLALDAANTKSYPGSGTTWTDLSGNGNHFTLYNSPTLTNNGLTFDGTNQYAQCNNTTCGNFGSSSYTLEYAVSFTSPTPSLYNCLLMKRGNITTIGETNNNGWAHRVGINGFFAQDDNPGQIQANIIQWQSGVTNNSPNVSYYSIVIARSGLGVTGTIYLNGNQILTQSTTFVGTGDISNSTAMSIFRNPGELFYTPGSLYLTRMYSRALSLSELKQNYNAIRGRYNI